MGEAGSGKTSFALRLAEETGAVHLNSDALRATIFGNHKAVDSVLKKDARRFYDDVHSALAYCAGQTLRSGESVILDAQLAKYSDRHRLEVLAKATGATPILVWMKTRREVAIRRALTRSDGPESRRFSRGEIQAVLELSSSRLELPTQSEPVLVLNGESDLHAQMSEFLEHLEYLGPDYEVDAA